MKDSLYRLAQFIIYSSLNVSVAACLFAAESFYLFELPIHSEFLAFVFLSTILTYSVHRYIGIRRLDKGQLKGRFAIEKKYRNAIGITAMMSIVLLSYLSLQLSLRTLGLFSLTGIICFLYVIPVMHKNKRIRDLPYIKIILIAFVWSFVAHIPVIELLIDELQVNHSIFGLSFIEKFIYIFLITLPFDVRDIELDKSTGVPTLPSYMGLEKSYRLIYFMLAVDTVLLLSIGYLKEMNITAYAVLLFSLIFSLIALRLSKGKNSDIYYSGHLDGVIIVRSLFILLAFLV